MFSICSSTEGRQMQMLSGLFPVTPRDARTQPDFGRSWDVIHSRPGSLAPSRTGEWLPFLLRSARGSVRVKLGSCALADVTALASPYDRAGPHERPFGPEQPSSIH